MEDFFPLLGRTNAELEERQKLSRNRGTFNSHEKTRRTEQRWKMKSRLRSFQSTGFFLAGLRGRSNAWLSLLHRGKISVMAVFFFIFPILTTDSAYLHGREREKIFLVYFAQCTDVTGRSSESGRLPNLYCDLLCF